MHVFIKRTLLFRLTYLPMNIPRFTIYVQSAVGLLYQTHSFASTQKVPYIVSILFTVLYMVLSSFFNIM